MPHHGFDQLSADAQQQIEAYAKEAGVTVEQAQQALVTRCIAMGGLSRAMARLDAELEQEAQQIEPVKPFQLRVVKSTNVDKARDK